MKKTKRAIAYFFFGLGQLFSLHPQDRSARIAKIRREQKKLKSRSDWSMIRGDFCAVGNEIRSKAHR